MNPITIKPTAQGKVRDLYDLGDKLLLVATDRISAFDYILPDGYPTRARSSPRSAAFGLSCWRM